MANAKLPRPSNTKKAALSQDDVVYWQHVADRVLHDIADDLGERAFDKWLKDCKKRDRVSAVLDGGRLDKAEELRLRVMIDEGGITFERIVRFLTKRLNV